MNTYRIKFPNGTEEKVKCSKCKYIDDMEFRGEFGNQFGSILVFQHYECGSKMEFGPFKQGIVEVIDDLDGDKTVHNFNEKPTKITYESPRDKDSK